MRRILSFLFFAVIAIYVSAQTPQSFSYQAVLRDAGNNLLQNQTVGVKITVLQGSASGVTVYSEIFNPNPQTNVNGLLSLEIGTGIPLSGTFSAIDWLNGPYYIQSDIDPSGATTYSISAVTQLLSVPYALYAKKAGSYNEADPVFTGSVAYGINSSDTTYWNNKLDAELDADPTNELQVLSISNDSVFLSNGGYVVLPPETDPSFQSSVAYGITSADTAAWNAASVGLYSETDPVFIASVAFAINSTDTAFWNNKLDAEVDGSVTNELQVLTISNDTIYLSDGGYAKLPEGFSGNYNDLTNTPDFTNWDTDVTDDFDGDYNNLTNQPMIPTVPTNVSAFTNDAGYLTTFTEVDGSTTNELQVLSIIGDRIYLSDGGFVDLPAGFSGNYNDLTNRPDFTNWDTDVTDDFDGDYNNLTNQPTIPTVPTNVSAFTNDAGYLTSFTEIDGSTTNELQVLSIIGDRIYLSDGGFVDLPAGFSGNYNDLTNRPDFTNWDTDVTDDFDGDYNNLTNTPDLSNFDTEVGNDWNHGGNAGTTPGTDFIGTTDAQDLVFKTNSIEYLRLTDGGRLEIYNTGHSVFIGENAGENDNLTSNENIAIGYDALRQNINGNSNIAIGGYALYSTDGGDDNISLGYNSMAFNTTGSGNVSLGVQSMSFNTLGDNNTAVGLNTMASNVSGYSNVAIGVKSLHNNGSGHNNVAVGDSSLYKNTVSDNTAIGSKAMYENTSGEKNTAVGFQAMNANTIGDNNTASGYRSLYHNQDGDDNTAYGYSALRSNTASGNTAMGSFSMYTNNTGEYNTAMGYNSLVLNNTGSENTAIGNYTMALNTSGSSNTALGTQSLFTNSTGYSNVAVGVSSLRKNSSGHNNVAVGDSALFNNTASNNTAIGSKTLFTNTSGYSNVAIGRNSLYNNTTGDYSIAIGDSALFTQDERGLNIAIGFKTLFSLNPNVFSGTHNIAIGYKTLMSTSIASSNVAVGSFSLYDNTSGAQNTGMGSSSLSNNTSGSYNSAFGFYSANSLESGEINTILGAYADVSLSDQNNSIAIGYDAIVTASNRVRIGNTSITRIGGQVSWSNLSDGRIKTNVQENVSGLDFIMKLRPVTYNFDKDKQDKILGKVDSLEYEGKYDIEQIRFTGFIAQEVEIAAQQTGFDFSGITKPENEHDFYGLRYAEFVVPLVKATQEQQVIIEEQNTRIDNLEEENIELNQQLESLQKQINELKELMQN